jgi:hypothetical protein
MRHFKSFFCNINNKNIYNENRKIPAARQQFSLRGSISVIAHPRSLGWTSAVVPQTFSSTVTCHHDSTRPYCDTNVWEFLDKHLPFMRFGRGRCNSDQHVAQTPLLLPVHLCLCETCSVQKIRTRPRSLLARGHGCRWICHSRYHWSSAAGIGSADSTSVAHSLQRMLDLHCMKQHNLQCMPFICHLLNLPVNIL